MRHWPVFAFLPVEAFIHRTQAAYMPPWSMPTAKATAEASSYT
jgi:hypothetical protein